MSFSTTLYRISDNFFRKLEDGSIGSHQLVKTAKNFVTFQDSVDAMLFILKSEGKPAGCDVEELFFPKERRGSVSDEEFQKLVDTCNYEAIERISASSFSFLSPEKVRLLNSFLQSVDDSDFDKRYDAATLNSMNVYPAMWASDENPDHAYNLNHLRTEFHELKAFFEQADSEKDYILAFSG